MLGEKLLQLRKKQGCSQQELADRVGVSRQTISNWECGQGAPTLDKALELAKFFQISLDDLLADQVEFVVKEEPPGNRLLSCLVGKRVRLSGADLQLWLDTGDAQVEVLAVSDQWLRIAYERTKECSLTKKERVIKLLDINMINGIQILED